MQVTTKPASQIEFEAKQEFDSKRMRHYINNELSVLHCHHYATLFSQLANDAKSLQGAKLLSEASEETFYAIFKDYFKNKNVNGTDARIKIIEQHCTFVGLGELKLQTDGKNWTAEMVHSHVDEGWIKKWSKSSEPVNFMGQGYIAAAVEAITDSRLGSWKVNETQSIVSGASSSKFNISKN